MKIPKSALIEFACSKNAARIAITHPYLDTSDPAKPVLVATSGVILAVVPVEATPGEAGYVSTVALKADRKLKTELGITRQGTAFLLGNGAVLPAETAADSKFPNWEQVVPNFDPATSRKITFNPTLLLNLAKAIGSPEGVTLEFDVEAQVFTVTPAGIHHLKMPHIEGAYGVLMGIRTP